MAAAAIASWPPTVADRLHRFVCGDCCGGFARTSPIRPNPAGGLTPQHPGNIANPPTPGSVLITRRSGVRIPPPLPRKEAPGVVRTSGALSFGLTKKVGSLWGHFRTMRQRFSERAGIATSCERLRKFTTGCSVAAGDRAPLPRYQERKRPES